MASSRERNLIGFEIYLLIFEYECMSPRPLAWSVCDTARMWSKHKRDCIRFALHLLGVSRTHAHTLLLHECSSTHALLGQILWCVYNCLCVMYYDSRAIAGRGPLKALYVCMYVCVYVRIHALEDMFGMGLVVTDINIQ